MDNSSGGAISFNDGRIKKCNVRMAELMNHTAKLATVGSVCSGIEAATVAWLPLGLKFSWFSEISAFPCRLLEEKYPDVPNLGDMVTIPEKILKREIEAPDIICGGTPCQAFSLAGGKNGLKDERGNLTLRFADIVAASDRIRLQEGRSRSVVLWENVEGILKDGTNAFGQLVCSLAGTGQTIRLKSWPGAGILSGFERTVAWRVLDAKYFGVP